MKYCGLTEEEVKKSREQNGSNTIDKVNSKSFIKLLIESLGDPMIKILLIVLGIKIFFLFADFDWFETLGIFIAIFVASLISTLSEYGSNKSFQKLMAKNNQKEIIVKRNNKLTKINIEEIVVNDIVIIKSGDYVPADGLIVAGQISVNESMINGETNDIQKSNNNSNLEFRKLYKGTVVTFNECTMKVTAVGSKTLFGSIAKEIQEDSGDSPLKLRLNHLAKIISKIGYIGAILVFFSYLFSVLIISNNYNYSLIIKTITTFPLLMDYIIYALTLAVTIIIVSVPEGLPMMVAIVLSTNMKRLLKNNVLVKKMVGIETAGSLNYLLLDKTGTITNGEMTVIAVIDENNKKYCNEIELQQNKSFYEKVGKSIIINNSCQIINNEITNGNSTDIALKKFMNFETNEKIISKEYFDSVKKYSSVNLNNIIYYKGAPEVLIPKCKNIDVNKVLINNSKYMHDGYRVIALGYSSSDLYELNFIGLVLLKDEIRNSSLISLKKIKQAGIKPIIITGDSLDTAIYICNELNFLQNNDICLTSHEIELMTDDEIKSNISSIKLIARAKPTDKSRIVKILKEMNYVVGMTGDGINDAPALKKADVGFAMGSGTDVAKEASDIVILDDNIESIISAILFGRTIFKNIRKFIIFQLTVNICAMTLSIIGPFIGISTPVTIIQMLWINMIMDTLAGLAFAYEEPNEEYLQEQPKYKLEPIINKYMYSEIFITGLYSSALCLIFLKSNLIKSIIRHDLNNKYYYTAFFALFVFIGIFNAFNTRTERKNLLYRINKNKPFIYIFTLVSLLELYFIYFGGKVFRTYGLNLRELLLVFGLSFTVIPFDIIRKKLVSK